MPEIACDGLWGDGPLELAEVPISAALEDRIIAWAEWNRSLDEQAWVESGETELHWERMPGAPVAAFNAEAHAIGATLRDELPDWKIHVAEVDAWLR